MQLKSDISMKGDMEGAISIRFKPGSTFNDYCVAHIANFDPDRFEVLAVRFYYGKETVITVYAIDKYRQERSNSPPHKIPVKKFKLSVAFLKDIESIIDECNFTITTGNYPIESMEVINK